MKTAETKEILKLLSKDEFLTYIFNKKLPDNFEHRLNESRRRSPEVLKANRDLKAMKLGLPLDLPKGENAWKRTALVLPVHQGQCLNCGTYFSAPYGHPLIKEVHPKLGTHLRQFANDEIGHEELPRELSLHCENVYSCANCFIDHYSKAQLHFNF